jgi:hypothetical protein
MIKLDIANQTTVQYLEGATVVSSTVTDTLYVSEVRLDFTTGAIYATIHRGTTDPSTGVFGDNYPALDIVVNPDGSFISSDGKWNGSLGAAVSNIMAQLQATFDQFVVASQAVVGKTTSNTSAPTAPAPVDQTPPDPTPVV